METAILSSAAALQLKSEVESHFFDAKSKRIAPAKLSRTLSAFANADGGEVFIGIEDKKVPVDQRWDGYADQEEANALIDVLMKHFPPGDTFSYSFNEANGENGLVLRCEIFKNSSVWSDTAGDIYIRRGAQSIKISDRDAIRRLEFSKGLSSYEDHILQSDIDTVVESETLSNFIANIVPSAEPLSWLRKQRLIIAANPTVAGAVLFSDEPQVVLPKAAIKIYRYKTSSGASRESLGGQPETIEGPAYLQIKDAVQRVVQTVEGIPVIRDSGFESVSYPNSALHEIITNAIIHRDYSLNDDVHITIFDNRIEIYSPGRLPAHVTTNNILDERFARNQKIVRMLNKFPDPPNKDVGEGLNTAFEAMRNLELREPEILETESGVKVVLRHEKLAQPETRIVDYLRENDEINNARAREITYIGSENSVKRIFQKLMKNEIIERIPGRAQSKAAYRKGVKFPE